MQSILSTTPPANPQVGDIKSETKKADDLAKTKTATSEDKSFADFANVLDNLIEGKLSEQPESESLLAEEELFLGEVKEESAEENQLISSDEVVDDSAVDKDATINPVIAQIEAAQKIDTSMSEVKPKVGGLESSSTIKEPQKGEKTLSKSSLKAGKASFEKTLPDDSAKELLTKEKQPSAEKTDPLLSSIKTELVKPITNNNIESNFMSTLGAASTTADKLLHQTATNNNVQLLQSAALQQPIELQSKHASAMMGERILMMLNQGKQEVTIRLDPAELGSMHIKLQVQQDQLQVSIQTQVGQSREIIEQNLPRLREQLAQQGINLGEATVQQQSKQDQSSSQQAQHAEINTQGNVQGDDGLIDEQNEWLTTQIPLPAQGIDYYA